MNNKYDLACLENKIKHTFQNEIFITRALTHSSYANERRSKGEIIKDNERMEYFGDSVLSLVTSEYLFFNHPEMPEGDLSKVRAETVCEKALYEYALQINLGDFLLLGKGEDKMGGREKPSILSDAFEALLCAIYIDSGIEEVKKFLIPFISKKIEEVSNEKSSDYKSTLQEFVAHEKGELLSYVTIRESGPDHDKIFEVEARLNSNVIGKGKAPNKREAEQLAAKEALELFGKK